MARLRFHKVASIVVLIGAAAWVLTGEFSYVGSAAQETPDMAATSALTETAKPLQTVLAFAVSQVDHRITIRISGQTAADKRVELSARSSGKITSLPFKHGDSVRAGAIIMDMDSSEKTVAVEAASQLVVQKKVKADATEELATRGNVAKFQLDAARADLQSAISQFEAAKADLQRTMVVAPFDGIVDKINVENGASASEGTVVAVVLSLKPIVAVGEVSERNLSAIKVGSPAFIRLANGARAEGTVRYISREASPATRTYRIEVAVANDDRSIPAGMTAEIDLKSDPIKAVKLPRSAVTLSADGTLGVRAVDKASKAVFLPVELIDDTTDAIVLTGVPDGTKVIISGQDIVADGDQLNVVEPDAQTLKRLDLQFAAETN